jgi:uroporphyrinogen-III synthase
MTTIPAPSKASAPTPVLLLTRPEPAASAFAAGLGGWPGPVVVSPLLEIVAVAPPAAVPDARALVFTSRNAVRFYGGPRDLPAFCVGAATRDAAAARGMAARVVGPDAAALVAALPGLAPPLPLLHVRGVHVAQPVAAQLAAAGLPCGELCVYDQLARPLSDAARAALAGDAPVLLPVFSPRSAALLGAALRDAPARAPCRFVAISAAVAARLAEALPGAAIDVAAAPDAAAMGEALHASARHVHLLEGRPPLP